MVWNELYRMEHRGQEPPDLWWVEDVENIRVASSSQPTRQMEIISEAFEQHDVAHIRSQATVSSAMFDESEEPTIDVPTSPYAQSPISGLVSYAELVSTSFPQYLSGHSTGTNIDLQQVAAEIDQVFSHCHRLRQTLLNFGGSPLPYAIGLQGSQIISIAPAELTTAGANQLLDSADDVMPDGRSYDVPSNTQTESELSDFEATYQSGLDHHEQYEYDNITLDQSDNQHMFNFSGTTYPSSPSEGPQQDNIDPSLLQRSDDTRDTMNLTPAFMPLTQQDSSAASEDPDVRRKKTRRIGDSGYSTGPLNPGAQS